VKAGAIDLEDALIVENMKNLKAAGQILAYRIRKKEEERRKEEERKIQLNGQVQMQSAQLAEEEKRKTTAMQFEADIKKIDKEKQWEFMIEEMKKKYDLQGEGISSATQQDIEAMKAESKEYIAEINAKFKTGRNAGQVASDLTK